MAASLNILFQWSTCSLLTHLRTTTITPVIIPAALGHGNVAGQIRCRASSQTSQTFEPAVSRRSGNYQPTLWSNDFLQSLKSDYTSDVYAGRVEKLKEAARRCLEEADGPLAQLELIDDLQRLGVGRLFEREIKDKLDTIYTSHREMGIEGDIHSAALCFRLLREHGFEVSPGIFSKYKDETSNFGAGLRDDPIGLLSLYEASYLCMEGETILDEAKAFTSRHLKELKKKGIHPNVVLQVEHALELPIHWRMPRLEARWYMEFYEKKAGMNPTLLELAKLDFNMVQSIYQSELRKVSRWWTNLGLADELSFARDRLMEDFFWAMGIVFEPQFGRREALTKSIQFITTIDDMYDVYASLEELELFTDSVERWDINTMEGLPEYMRICFLALYNTTNDQAYDILREHGLDIIPYLRKTWADYCKAGLVEARWFNRNYTPTLEEYLNNAWISISGPLMLIHTFLFLGQKPSKEAIEYFMNRQHLIHMASAIFRLTDDLGTSTGSYFVVVGREFSAGFEHEGKIMHFPSQTDDWGGDEMAKGDVPKSIQCYMHEAGVSEEIAREHIRGVIGDIWKQMNQHLTTPPAAPLSKSLITAAFDLARTSTCVYLYGDGFGVPDGDTKANIMSLLVQPILL